MDDTDPSPTGQHDHRPSVETMSSAATDELIDELYTLELQTSDGWFEAEITQIVPTGEEDQLAVSVVVVSGDMVTWHLDKPDRWTDEYLFVRLADQYDYGERESDLLVGETLNIRPETGAADAVLDTTGTWELRDPGLVEPEPTRIEKLSSFITDVVGALTLFGLMVGAAVGAALYLLPGGTTEQVIYWGGIVVWLFGSIGYAVSPETESPSGLGSQPTRIEKIGGFIFYICISLLFCGILLGVVMSITLLVFPGGPIEQLIYWGGLLVWLFGSIGLGTSYYSHQFSY